MYNYGIRWGQYLACQFCRILKNKRLTEIEIQLLQKETEKDNIASEIVDTVSELSYRGSSGTETVKEQCCDLDDFPGATREDHM